MANSNTSNILNQNAVRATVEEFLNKEFLERGDWDGVLANSVFGDTEPIPSKEGQHVKFTRKNRIRRPETMATPGGTGSDPASGVTLGVRQLNVPLEWIHEFATIATVTQETAWFDIKQFAKEDMPVALKRRAHELVQNAIHSGRMAPGVYASDGTLSTNFDATTEATVTLYGQSFTFESCPRYYANGRDQFDQLQPEDKLTWQDLKVAWIKLDMAHAPKINGTYVCVLSSAMWMGLLEDPDSGNLTAAMAGGFKPAIKGLETIATFNWAGWTFIIDDQPLTLNSSDEDARANYGPIHVANCFGAHCFGFVPLGSKTTLSPRMKMQDISKTGFEFSLGYLVPFQVAVLNADWGCSIAGYVSEQFPNNFDPSDATRQLDGFSVS